MRLMKTIYYGNWFDQLSLGHVMKRPFLWSWLTSISMMKLFRDAGKCHLIQSLTHLRIVAFAEVKCQCVSFITRKKFQQLSKNNEFSVQIFFGVKDAKPNTNWLNSCCKCENDSNNMCHCLSGSENQKIAITSC